MVAIISAAIGGSVGAGLLGAGIVGGIGSVAGSVLQSNAANKAIGAEQNMFNTAVSKETPFINAGASAIPTLQSLITPGPNQTQTLQQTPGFQFLSDWGNRGVVNNASAVGGFGGNVGTALSQYNQGLALNNAWLPTVNALQSLVSTGAGAAGNIGQQAVGTGANVGNALIGQGNAQAAGVVGGTSSIGNALTTNALLQALKGGTGMYGANPGTYGGINPGNYGTIY